RRGAGETWRERVHAVHAAARRDSPQAGFRASGSIADGSGSGAGPGWAHRPTALRRVASGVSAAGTAPRRALAAVQRRAVFVLCRREKRSDPLTVEPGHSWISRDPPRSSALAEIIWNMRRNSVTRFPTNP